MILSLLVVAVLGVFALPAFAQTSTFTRNYTESQVNQAYRVSNPRRAAISSITVDLQPGQAVISSTHNYRQATYNVVTTVAPNVANGRPNWTIISIVAQNGESLPADVTEQVRSFVTSRWGNFARTQRNTTLQSVVITDSDITYTYSR
jgi:Tfp pilus assembly protein FimT